MINSRKFKVLILGDPQVGKTSIRKTYMGQGFQTNYLPTMGVDFAVKTINRDQSVDLQIWDIAGQQGYSVLMPRFVKNTDGVFIVFDLTRKDTLDNIVNWLDNFIENNEASYQSSPIIVLGNKDDLDNQIEVLDNEVEDYIKKMLDNNKLKQSNVKYFHTSAKTGYQIDEAFNFMVDILLQEE